MIGSASQRAREPMRGTTNAMRRARASGAGSTCLTRSDGQRLPCNVIDLSASCVSVKTHIKPPLGEYVLIGQMAGRIEHHYRSGVRIKFVGGAPYGHLS